MSIMEINVTQDTVVSTSSYTLQSPIQEEKVSLDEQNQDEGMPGPSFKGEKNPKINESVRVDVTNSGEALESTSPPKFPDSIQEEKESPDEPSQDDAMPGPSSEGEEHPKVNESVHVDVTNAQEAMESTSPPKFHDSIQEEKESPDEPSQDDAMPGHSSKDKENEVIHLDITISRDSMGSTSSPTLHVLIQEEQVSLHEQDHFTKIPGPSFKGTDFLLLQEDAEKLVDDNSSESDIIIRPSVWDCVSDDEMLISLGLDKHAASEDVFTRQMEAQSLLDTLRADCDNERDCIAVFERFNTLADDLDPIVRVELMEQVPHIALFCQENWPSVTFAFSKYLLSVVVRYLTDQNHEVCETSQEVLLTLLEQELIGQFDVETKVCPVLMEMTVPNSDKYMKAQAVPIMCKMPPMVGKDITECLILPRFCEMCCDCRTFHVRKVCAAKFGDICSVVGQQATEEVLLPRFCKLCSDNEWVVRKACAECFMTVSYATSEEIRWTKLSALFINLVRDPSRWVCQAAFRSLGPFICTFSNSSSSGQYFKEESNSSEDISEDKSRIRDQGSLQDGQIRSKAVPLDINITNSSVKLGNTLEDSAGETSRYSSGEINILGDSCLLCTLPSESQQEAASKENGKKPGNCESVFQPEAGTSSEDYTHLYQELYNSFDFWRTFLPEIDLDVDLKQDSGKTVIPQRPGEAHKLPVPGSPKITMATRKELEKMIENLEPHIDDSDAKAQVEVLSDVLHTSRLDVPGETFGTEQTLEVQEELGVSEKPNCNINQVDSVPLIRNADENIDTTAHYVHSDANVSSTGGFSPEEERRPEVQDVVPQVLLDQYLEMTNSSLAETVDNEIAKHCAYSLPGVALTLGKRNWHCLRETYKILASDMQYEVRRHLAFSIHVFALILGDQLTVSDLVPIFNGFLKDVDEVRIGVLKHLHDFLKLLHSDKRREYLPELQEFLVTDNSRNWRFRAELAGQLILLLKLYSPLDVYKHLRPIALKLCADKVSSVRCISYKLVGEMVRKLHTETPLTLSVYLINELVKNFGRSPKWSGRQAFVYICQTVIENDCLPMNQFAIHLMPHMLTLVNDRVPNVGMLLAKTLGHILLKKE